jgi:hypothetical protein
VWAAACCLGAQPLDARDALDLHARLGLRCPTWAYRRLVADAGNERLVWPPDRRHVHLNWLIASETLAADGPLSPASHLARAVAWWQQRYDKDDARQARHETRLTPFRHTPAERRRALEQALLALYTDPDAAAPTLGKLAGPGLAEEIHGRLATLAARDQRPPTDVAGRGAVYLPWDLARRPPRTQRILVGLGFGGERYRASTRAGRPPARLGLALSALGIIGLTTLGTGLWHQLYPIPVTIRPTEPVLANPVLATQLPSTIDYAPDGGYTVSLGSARLRETVHAPAGSVLTVDWAWEVVPTVDREGEMEIWRTGSLPAPIRGCEDGWPDRSLIALAAAPTDPQAREVAIALLDAGSADVVAFLGQDWTGRVDDLARLARNGPPDQQTLLLLLDAPGAAADEALGRLPRDIGGAVAAVAIPSDRLRMANAREIPPTYAERAREGVSVDPLATKRCELRVLRGGSFYLSPWVLRSALRAWVEPRLRLDVLGFRCVRVPARQP